MSLVLESRSCHKWSNPSSISCRSSATEEEGPTGREEQRLYLGQRLHLYSLGQRLHLYSLGQRLHLYSLGQRLHLFRLGRKLQPPPQSMVPFLHLHL